MGTLRYELGGKWEEEVFWLKRRSSTLIFTSTERVLESCDYTELDEDWNFSRVMEKELLRWTKCHINVTLK